MSRTIAIGDIHGCARALEAILEAIQPVPTDVLIFLGDYLDRGPDSRGVVDQVLLLERRCRVVPLLGNHEEVLLDALADTSALKRWLTLGGTDTLRSYGWTRGGPARSLSSCFPESHRQLFARCRSHFETATHLFVHAGYQPDRPLEGQPGLVLRWRVTSATRAIPHISGKVAVVGHTAQQSGEILDLGCLVCIDTNCVRGGWLTALEVGTGRVWQADRAGRLRARSERS